MSLRFASIADMESAFGRKFNIRDSFAENVHGPMVSQPAVAQIRIAPTRAEPVRSASAERVRTRKARPGITPHDILWAAVVSSFGDQAVREFENVVPGRKYRLDIAIPAERLAIEVDGWEWHGKHKGDFTRDRERQNLLTLHGWRILRFTAGQIRKDAAGCVEMIGHTIGTNIFLGTGTE